MLSPAMTTDIDALIARTEATLFGTEQAFDRVAIGAEHLRQLITALRELRDERDALREAVQAFVDAGNMSVFAEGSDAALGKAHDLAEAALKGPTP